MTIDPTTLQWYRLSTRMPMRRRLAALVGSAVAVLATAACAPPPPSSLPGNVERVIDGDTIVMVGGERVRLIGIDAPESGQCGANDATALLIARVAGQQAQLTPGARTDRDEYGRLLRYVDISGFDVQLELLERRLCDRPLRQPGRLRTASPRGPLRSRRCGTPEHLPVAPKGLDTPPAPPRATQGSPERHIVAGRSAALSLCLAASPTAAMDDVVERAAIEVLDGPQGTVRRIAESEHVCGVAVGRQTEDSAGGVLISDR